MAEHETPTDEAAPPQKKRGSRRKHVPNRALRKRVLGQGEGDVCIYEIIGEGHELPQGSLVPIPDVPRFENTTDALRWLKWEQNAERLASKTVMIFWAREILQFRTQSRVKVDMVHKPKYTIHPRNPDQAQALPGQAPTPTPTPTPTPEAEQAPEQSPE